MAVKNKTKRMRGNLWKTLHATVAKKFSVRVTGINPGGTLRLRKATASWWYGSQVTDYMEIKLGETIPFGAIGAHIENHGGGVGSGDYTIEYTVRSGKDM